MRPSLPFSLLSLSLLLLLLPSFHTKAKAQQLIQTTCKTSSEQNLNNIDYVFCTTSLQAAPASRCATLQDLGNISFQLIKNNLTDTKCLIKELKKNKKLDPFVKGCLDDCLELYSDAILAINKAKEHYNMKRYTDANIEISSVMDAATTCEDGFKEKSGVISPLTKMNDDTFELSAISLSIMHMIDIIPSVPSISI